MIKVEHLKKRFENSEPLKDINLTINDGEVVSIIGPSGTGKSTFLRCLNLLEKPTSGHIWINDIDITKKNVSINKIRQKIGFVFQAFNLYKHLTAVENVMYAQVKLLGRSKEEAYKKSIELLEMVGLAGRALQYPNQLSGGQQQRVAIARTLAMDPEIILFDEPTSALDPLAVDEVADVIFNLAKQGKTMIIVTHEMEFAKNISKRILFFAEGIVYEDGTPEQIFDHPTKEKTKLFMQNVGVRNIEIIEGVTDHFSVMTDIKRFAVKYGIENTYSNKLQLIIEEFMIAFFKPNAKKNDKMRVVLKYDKNENKITCNIFHNIEKSFLHEDSDVVSSKLIKNAAKTIVEKKSDDAEYITNLECTL